MSLWSLHRLCMLLLISVSLLGLPGSAAELPIMDDAIAAISGGLTASSESAANQIAQLYKSFVNTDSSASPYADWTKWIRIMFPEPKTIMTAFVANLCW